MATLVYGILSQAIMFVRLYGIFCQRTCSRCYAFLRSVLFMFLATSGFTRSAFIVCLSCVWLNQLRLRRWRSKSAQTLWTGR